MLIHFLISYMKMKMELFFLIGLFISPKWYQKGIDEMFIQSQTAFCFLLSALAAVISVCWMLGGPLFRQCLVLECFYLVLLLLIFHRPLVTVGLTAHNLSHGIFYINFHIRVISTEQDITSVALLFYGIKTISVTLHQPIYSALISKVSSGIFSTSIKNKARNRHICKHVRVYLILTFEFAQGQNSLPFVFCIEP